jgi:FG-GAP-like repeat
VPGVDFNGDGADDIAVTRNDGANKIWHWLESGTGNYRVAHFGLSSDKVLVGDFDGDSKSDLAVFRPSEGNWYVNGSEQGFFVLRWGLGTDIPIPSAHLP